MKKFNFYKSYYDNTLLQSVPRILNRKKIGIESNALPFHGYDIWKLYELSWLNEQGLPQVAIGQVFISANSKHLIESKSFKLYLNSFNQTKFHSWDNVSTVIQNDLCLCLECNSDDIIKVNLFKLNDFKNSTFDCFIGKCIDDQEIQIADYTLNPSHLKHSISKTYVEETLFSNLLKSNCPMTNQPDWGSVMISYQGYSINHDNLLRYLVSFRQHNEFQEHCIERIFSDIQYYCAPKSLSVYGCYTRRGGLEINSWRSNMDFVPKILRLVRQ